MISWVVRAVAAVVAWFFSDERRALKAKVERRASRDAVYGGDEGAVNARIADKLLVLALAAATFAGCAVTPVYVREADRVFAVRPGEVFTNGSEVVWWAVPPAILHRLIEKEEKR